METLNNSKGLKNISISNISVLDKRVEDNPTATGSFIPVADILVQKQSCGCGSGKILATYPEEVSTL